MLNIRNRAGILTFEIQKEKVTLAINCKCIKDEWIDLIVDEFRAMENKFIEQGGINEMEKPL